MEKQKKDKNSETKKNKIKKPWKKYLLLGLLGLIAVSVFLGYRFYKIKKFQVQRTEFMQRQQEIMIETWKEDGLTDEEIQEKLENMQKMRKERFDNSDRTLPEGFDMTRMGGQMRRMAN